MNAIERLRRDHNFLRATLPLRQDAFAPQDRDPGTVQAAGPACLCDTMTPNWIVRQYPQTQAVFDELSINLAFEGSDGLDEVAWRHGVSDQELLQKLERLGLRMRAGSDRLTGSL